MREACLNFQFGSTAIKVAHPLLSIVSAPEDELTANSISKLSHAAAITAVASWQNTATGQTTLLSADDDGRLKLWHCCAAPASLVPAGSHLLHRGAAINCLALHSPTGLLATASADGRVMLWDLLSLLQCSAGRHTAAQRGCLSHHCDVAQCSLSTCGTFLASCAADGCLRLWHTTTCRLLAELPLQARSPSFLPCDAAALLLVAEQGLEQCGPVLLDLSAIPACRQYCAAVAAANHSIRSPTIVAGRGGPGGGGAHVPPRPSVRQQRSEAAPASRTPRLGSGGSCQRGSALCATSSMRRRQLEAEAVNHAAAAVVETETETEREAAAAAAAAAAAVLVMPPHQHSVAAWSAWCDPRSPTSPAPSQQECCVPAAAVAARYEEPGSSGGAEWDVASRSFVNRQGGHTLPAHTLLPLPASLHVLSVAGNGEAKLWPVSGGSSPSLSDSCSGSAVCCTLLPSSTEQQGLVVTQPTISSDDRFVVFGMQSGCLVCWDLFELQRTSHLPLNRKLGNAAAASRWSDQPLTAIALSACGTLVMAGDAAGRLMVRWR
ncbi:hypothetical protein ACK3TF_004409 [Chlorella vulgaris]